MVVRPSHTRQTLAKAAMEHINLVGAKVIGVVLNRIPLRGADYYAGKNYLFAYYGSSYGGAYEGRENKNFSGSFFFTDLEKMREFLSPYTNKVTAFFKNRQESIRSRFQTKS